MLASLTEKSDRESCFASQVGRTQSGLRSVLVQFYLENSPSNKHTETKVDQGDQAKNIRFKPHKILLKKPSKPPLPGKVA
jgi:hypothetical protein